MFIAASAAMNWMFMIAQGKTVLEGQVLGLVSIAIDVVKALMPFFIGAAWAHRQWLRTLLGAGVFGLFFSFSLLSALGFVATSRGAVANSRAALSSQLESARKELGETEARLAALGMTVNSRLKFAQNQRFEIVGFLALLVSILWFDPRREHSSIPTANSRSRRAQGLSRLAASSRPPEGPGLDRPEHGGTLVWLGLEGLASS
ncbi:MAG: hypothetical protein ACLPOA_08680 [Methylocella sp.]